MVSVLVALCGLAFAIGAGDGTGWLGGGAVSCTVVFDGLPAACVRRNFGPSMAAAAITARVTIEPRAMYRPRRLLVACAGGWAGPAKLGNE